MGFSDLISDTVFRRVIWYNILRGYDDSIYVMYADQLRALGDAAGVSVTSIINTKIATEYSWNSVFDWASIISKQMWGPYGKVNPLMGVPKLYQFSKSGFISATTNVAYTHLEWDYPVPCVTFGSTLDSSDVRGKAAWVFFTNIPPFIYTPEKQYKAIVNCFIGYTQLLPQPCMVCPPVTLTSYSTGSSHSAASHEIGIWLNLSDGGSVCGTVLDANTIDDAATGYAQIIQSNLSSSNYAVLDALPGNYWHKVEDPNTNVTLYKSVTPPISDALGPYPSSAPYPRQYSNRITLCRDGNLFYDYYSSGSGNRMFLDYGGIYRVQRPGIVNLVPMYFYFSPFNNFTFTQGPDMNLNYDGAVQSSNCSGGNTEFLASPTFSNCLFGPTFDYSFNTTNGRDYFANPVLSNLTAFWEDNAISVGFSPNDQSSVLGNYLTFYADNTGQTCTLPGNTGNLILTLSSINSTSTSEGDGYETVKMLNAPYSSGYQFVVHVQAVFVNGETINDCQYLTINSNVTSVDRVVSMIRGNISDYSSSPINYQIDVYETQ